MTANLSTIKKELQNADKQQLIDVVLRLSKYKVDNKSLVTYLLFEAENEAGFIEELKVETADLFHTCNFNNFYYFKKGIRKVIRFVDKNIKFSGKKETEVEMRLYLLELIMDRGIDMNASTVLTNMFNSQLKKIEKALEKLHEDLQFDFQSDLEACKKYISEKIYY